MVAARTGLGLVGVGALALVLPAPGSGQLRTPRDLLPVASVRASADSILAGETVTLALGGGVRGRLTAVPPLPAATRVPPGAGQVVVTPSESTTYSYVVWNADSVQSGVSRQRVVVYTLPTAALATTATTVLPGERFHLTAEWSEGDRASLSPIGPISSPGEPIPVTADTSTAYVLTVTGPGGHERRDTIQVTVLDSLPVQLEGPPSAAANTDVSLRAISDYALSGYVEAISVDGVERLPLPAGGDGGFDQTITVRPERTTTYVFTVSRAGHIATATHTVVVPEAPRARITGFVDENDGVTLEVSGVRATSGVLAADDGSHGPDSLAAAAGEDLAATVEVDPEESTRFVFTAEGPGGSDTTAAVVLVRSRGGWDFGVGAGAMGIVSDPSSLFTWTLALSAERRDRVFVTLQGGGRTTGPAGSDPVTPLTPRPQFTDRSQRAASVGATWFLHDHIGPSATLFGGWELVSGLDDYLTRILGVGLGFKTRWSVPLQDEELVFVVGYDAQRSHVKRFDQSAGIGDWGGHLSLLLTLQFH